MVVVGGRAANHRGSLAALIVAAAAQGRGSQCDQSSAGESKTARETRGCGCCGVGVCTSSPTVGLSRSNQIKPNQTRALSCPVLSCCPVPVSPATPKTPPAPLLSLYTIPIDISAPLPPNTTCARLLPLHPPKTPPLPLSAPSIHSPNACAIGPGCHCNSALAALPRRHVLSLWQEEQASATTT